jgi:hypothetical protein
LIETSDKELSERQVRIKTINDLMAGLDTKHLDDKSLAIMQDINRQYSKLLNLSDDEMDALITMIKSLRTRQDKDDKGDSKGGYMKWIIISTVSILAVLIVLGIVLRKK